MLTDPPSAATELTSPIPAKAGVGLRHPHMADFASGAPRTAWVEIHSENYFAPGGPRLAQLEAARSHFPISCHGVGLSLGSADGLDMTHLATLKSLIDRFEPALVSDHVSFSVVDGVYVNDLLPMPYTREALDVMARNIDQAQTVLGRQMLIENPSSYLAFTESDMTEWEFLSELIGRTGCGLLLDVNNIYVSAQNNGMDTAAYLTGIPAGAVQEIHLAGHLVDGEGDDQLLIDTHGDVVADAVWTLFEQTLKTIGPRPTLIEWDTDIPALDVLLAEAAKADRLLGALALRQDDAHVA